MKKDCHFRMIAYVFQKVKEDVERKKEKQLENEQKRGNKKEQREKEIQIMKLRPSIRSVGLKKFQKEERCNGCTGKTKKLGNT